MDLGKIREEAVVLNEKGLDLYAKIAAGEEGIEKREEADAWIKEAGEKMDFVKGATVGFDQHAYLIEGVGSLTAGTTGGNGDMPPEPKWKSVGEFALAVAAVRDPSMRATLETKGRLPKDWETKLLAEATGETGGFLVPEEYRMELFQKAYEASIVRPRATVIPMSVPTLHMPSLDQTIVPNAPLSAFFGGLVFHWTEEGYPKTDVEFTFKQITLSVHEYSGYLPVTNILLADSAISLETLIRTQFGKTAVAYEDWHYLNGDDVGKPQGVITADCTIQIDRDGAGHIVWDDIIAMVHAFQPGANGVWVIHHCCLEELLVLQDANNNYMWIPNMRDGLPERLLGYPIIWTEKVPNLGEKGDIGLYDFSYYLIGDRQQPTIDSSIHYKFIENQTVFRLSARVDGRPWLSAPVMVMPDGSHSISPFVDLDVAKT